MVITFFGTKGGTGTTTLAVNCAADLRRVTGRTAIVVDLKTGPGDVAVFLGLRPRLTVLDLIDRLPWMDRALVPGFVAEHGSGLHVLAAAEEFGRPAPRDAESVEHAIACLASLYAFVIVDAGSGLHACSAAAMHASDQVWLVANPDLPCFRNLQRLTDALRLAGVGDERLRLVLNRASESGVLGVDQIEGLVNRAVDHVVASDYRTAAAAVNTGVPISYLRPSDMQRQLDAMARAIASAALAAAS